MNYLTLSIALIGLVTLAKADIVETHGLRFTS